jgi:DMSO reductase family type II enzyme molybdopterin subunit
MSVTRRQFLRYSGVGGLSLSLGQLAFTNVSEAAGRGGPSAAGTATASPQVEFVGWKDVYREHLRWDRVVKGTHQVNCWYQRGCTFNVFVKDGMVMREEQAATYPQTNAFVPDFNPRGCQKGCSYSDRMYDASRLRHPLKRVGERGEQKWKRVSWQEAMDDIADRVIDTLRKEGPRSVYWDMGGGMTNGAAMVGLVRTIRLLDMTVLDIDSEVGDHHPGAAVTCGKITFSSSADDVFYSDLILIWGGNPAYTQIPNAHFINEARYKGAQIVAVTPDLNASGIHTDLWVPVNVGSDAALGLAMARVIIEEQLHDEAFVREQTDLPFLVDPATQRFLRASDLEEDGADDEFYFFDLEARKIQKASKKTLELGEHRPALEGRYEVETLNGRLTVTPVFELLREHVSPYTLEAAAKITGTPPKLIESLARQIAKARSATILTQSNFSKFYHGMEMERAQFLVMALCGQFGKKGSGLNAFPMIAIDGNFPVAVAPPPMPDLGPFLARLWEGLGPKEDETEEMFYLRTMREMHEAGNFMSSTLLFHVHGGLAPLTGSARRWDPHLPRESEEYLQEAFQKGWQMVPPVPRILFSSGGNIMRRVRGHDRLVEGFLPKLDLMVTIDWHMSQTALYSDYVLPAAGWYERDDIVWATPLAPFTQATTKAVEPYADSKTDWEIHYRLMESIQKRALERGETDFVDHYGDTRSLEGVFDDFSYWGQISAEDPEPLLKASLFVTSNLGGVSWEELKEKGYARHTGLGRSPMNITNATDIEPGETITANTWHTHKKLPWPTLTRRMQFYIDHEFYLELGEQLPTHKDNPPIGGDYPLRMTGGHTRWSIHSSWRDHKLMLDLQRGEPAIFISESDAAARDIRDGDRVRVGNDLGQFELVAKVSAAIRPGQVVVYHAWEPFQFADHKSHQAVTATPMNPIQMAGGYYHLQQFMTVGQPGMNDRGTRVEVTKLEVKAYKGALKVH